MTACFSVDLKLSNMLYPSLVLILSLLTLSQAGSQIHVSNLDIACLKCICAASTTCDKNFGCTNGHCGPFYINRGYWEVANKINANDKIGDIETYKSCVHDYNCAAKVVSDYMAKTGRDCNGDGIVDCDDYARLHFYGKDRCDRNIRNTPYNDRYLACMPPKPTELQSK